MPSKAYPHPEERPGGARLEGRAAFLQRAPEASRSVSVRRGLARARQLGNRKTLVARIAILLLITVALAGCGKKGAPQPPPDEPNTYPRAYPSV